MKRERFKPEIKIKGRAEVLLIMQFLFSFMLMAELKTVQETINTEENKKKIKSQNTPFKIKLSCDQPCLLCTVVFSYTTFIRGMSPGVSGETSSGNTLKLCGKFIWAVFNFYFVNT